MTREAQKQRSMTGITKRTYNNFSALENEVECSICNNFGHEDSECRSRFQQTKEQPSNTKTWRIKEPQTKRCGITFYAEGQENLWYIDSGCSKHMTGDKEKLESYSALEKGKKVSFGNDTPAAIKGKGTAQLKEKVKAGNVCETLIKGKRTPNNLYIFEEGQQQCYLSKDDEHWLWHSRLGHLSFSQIRKACKYQAVRGLPDIKIPDNTICLMKHKDEAFEKIKSFKALVENELGYKIKCLRSNRGGEFTSNEFFDFFEEHGIRREFSTVRTPRQNGVVERMNRIVQQMARAMLDESGTPATFWGEAAYVVVVILKKTNVRVNSTQTPNEHWYGETPSVKHFNFFWRKCYIKNTDEQLGKLEPRADEGILLGYSPHSKAYKCYNKRLGRIVDSIDVVVDENGYIPRQVNHENIEEHVDYPQRQNDEEEEPQEAPHEHIRIEDKTPSRYVKKNHPKSQILGQKEAGVQTRRTIAEASSYLALLSSTEP
eukprot:PITA_24419